MQFISQVYKCPCGPKLWSMFKHPWGLTQGHYNPYFPLPIGFRWHCGLFFFVVVSRHAYSPPASWSGALPAEVWGGGGGLWHLPHHEWERPQGDGHQHSWGTKEATDRYFRYCHNISSFRMVGNFCVYVLYRRAHFVGLIFTVSTKTAKIGPLKNVPLYSIKI